MVSLLVKTQAQETRLAASQHLRIRPSDVRRSVVVLLLAEFLSMVIVFKLQV